MGQKITQDKRNKKRQAANCGKVQWLQPTYTALTNTAGKKRFTTGKLSI